MSNMANRPGTPKPPDPPGGIQNTAYRPTSWIRGSSRPSRSLANTLTTPTPPQPLASELVAYDAGKARKLQATAGPEDRPAPPDPTYLGTPRSLRLKNLFTGAMAPPNFLDIARKLNNLVENNVKLPKKGAEKISIGSETAADIKTLTVRLLELAEFNSDIPTIRRNPFSGEDEDHQVGRALAGANTFGCKVPDVIEARLDHLTKTLERIECATTAPRLNFDFRATGPKSSAPSYALAALKHAPQVQTTRQTGFKPVQVPTLTTVSYQDDEYHHAGAVGEGW